MANSLISCFAEHKFSVETKDENVETAKRQSKTNVKKLQEKVDTCIVSQC